MGLLSLVVLAPRDGRGATYYVATTGSDNNPGTQAQPFGSIQQGINAAANGDTVQVAPGTYFEINIGWDRKSLILQGAGPAQSIVDAQGLNACFFLNRVPATARISGFTIRNGVGQYGGAMWNLSSTLTISNCNFVNNSGPSSATSPDAGAMYNWDGAPTVIDCIFLNNGAKLGAATTTMDTVTATVTITMAGAAHRGRATTG